MAMKANIWTLPELCLYGCSNYGSFPSAVDLCVVCITPNTLHPSTPFLPLGPGIPVSHVLSVRLQALLRPAQLSSPSSFSSHPTPLDSFCVSPTTTSVLSEHFTFFFFFLNSLTVHSLLRLGFPVLNFPYLKVFLLYFSTFCLVCLLISDLFFFLCLSPLGVRKVTMDYAVTSLYPRQMLSCQIQVRPFFYFVFFILQ